MGAKYSASGSQTITSGTADTALSIAANATTAHRLTIYDVTLGIAGDATPADVQLTYTAQRISAVGTATAVTPTRLDLADRESQAQAGENHTVEPTYTATEELLEIPLYHRSTYRWVAPPGSGLVVPATTNAGVGFFTIHASNTSDYRVTALFEE